MPYSETHWKSLGATGIKSIEVKDHDLMSPEKMDEAAEFIHNNIQNGKTVYVHCRAGVGRSATAIAAYLIKHKSMDIVDIISAIEGFRPASTIGKKMQALTNYQEWLKNQ